ncbi:MAG: UDP-glucose/GDP-mannose dehydrogenase family protein [Chloroflexi bacterium]|nr:UDP-glucose/GDP-mannose dehydrogenase family protein [Chloroflexota bacterium]
MAKIGVIGAGYVGLVTGACLAEFGHNVTCVEIDTARFSLLEQGELPIYEPELDELVARHRLTGRLSFASEFAPAIPASEFAFIAVQTPQGPDGGADTSFVFAAAQEILEHARPELIIVTKSTVPPGTGDRIAEIVADAGRPDIEVVVNPEFLREGTAVTDFLKPDRVVVGASSATAGARVAGLYAPLDAPLVRCDRRSAELAKYAANALLATRISYMNEIAAVCDAVHADVSQVARIIGLDHRIGSNYLSAGLGFGGACLPKDVNAIIAIAAQHGYHPTILSAVLDVNARQRRRAVDHLLEIVGTTTDATVGVLGLAFKPDTDDVRGAPAIDVIRQLCERGIRVRAHDPIAIANARQVLPDVEYCSDPYSVAKASDALLLATEWSSYLNLDWKEIRALMRRQVVFDGRNVLNREMLVGLGYTYLSFGCHANGVKCDRVAASPVRYPDEEVA